MKILHLCYLFFWLGFELASSASVHRCAAGRSAGELTGCCTDADPCPVGVGDCNTDSQCSGSNVCGCHDMGDRFGYTNSAVDVCSPHHSCVQWLSLLESEAKKAPTASSPSQNGPVFAGFAAGIVILAVGLVVALLKMRKPKDITVEDATELLSE
eukprot:TRINITY_DN7796_c0_g1_i2.p1 TRINITY_DN7796_c0_g1~~TRINITY_DN7796_c0_g1_i2.p1  ORF type:complete len:169 (+),score=40.08 TRINITY_DN7796_c0_g1_i2:44-508(+)